MIRTSVVATAAFTAATAMIVPAHAETPWETMAKFGWTGRWAQDCKTLSGPGNWHVRYAPLPTGNAERRMERGLEVRFSTIEAVQVAAPHVLQVSEVYGRGWGEFDGTRKQYVLRFADDHRSYRSIESAFGANQAFINEGVMVPTGNESPRIEKCAD